MVTSAPEKSAEYFTAVEKDNLILVILIMHLSLSNMELN